MSARVAFADEDDVDVADQRAAHSSEERREAGARCGVRRVMRHQPFEPPQTVQASRWPCIQLHGALSETGSASVHVCSTFCIEEEGTTEAGGRVGGEESDDSDPKQDAED